MTLVLPHSACAPRGYIAATLRVNAETKPEEEALRKLPQAFSDAFSKHDGHQLAKIMADDVDFVTVGARWIHGRPDFEKFHTRLLSGRFREATITPLQTEVRFLRPDVAVVHWSWSIAGDKNLDGTLRQPRSGMMTMVAEKRNDAWLVVVSQNDNANCCVGDGEDEGIKTPMPVPGNYALGVRPQ